MDLSIFYSQFRDETIENIRVLNSGLIALESTELNEAERRGQIDSVFRAMHTIKGSARVLGCEDIGRIAHTCEHILGAVREGRRTIDRALADDLLRGGDAILDMVNALVEDRKVDVNVDALVTTLGRGKHEGGAPVPAPQESANAATNNNVSPSAPVPAPEVTKPAAPDSSTTRARGARQTIRVRVDRLDRLLNLAGELAVAQQTKTAHLQAIEEAKSLLAQQQRMLLVLETEIARLRLSPRQHETLSQHVNGILNTGERAHKSLRQQTEQFTQHVNQTEQLIEDLEQEVMAVRLLPVSTLFTHLPRAVREIANQSNKDIALTLSGEATELDRKIIEALNDPLIHIVRNAVDHGIEQPDEREASGKPRQGSLHVKAQALGSHVHITITDDGRGMDPQLLRQSAVRKGLMAEEATAQLNDQEALELIFMPGFSTAKMITDISGRGVGMDIVRTNIAEIGGQVLLESAVGAGTTITLVLPLTLVTTRVLLVEAGDQIFALPASGCQGTMWTVLDHVPTVEGRAMLSYESQLVPIYRLSDLLNMPAAPLQNAQQRLPTVIIGSGQRLFALLVDRLLDEREVVVKSMGALMEHQRHYGGAIQLGDGSLLLLLNPTNLAQLARGIALNVPHTQPAAARQNSHLLVADDSFTTRELIRSILQSAGYEVTTAIDGLDALDKLRNTTYDLVVSDVEMPRVDGFTLTDRIRKELGRTNLPVVIVTSLASDAHRRRGLEVGAQAYIIKSQFNQGNLLETVRQLLGSEA
jgi:two-component system chemotaxis sensor kinase CheA